MKFVTFRMFLLNVVFALPHMDENSHYDIVVRSLSGN